MQQSNTFPVKKYLAPKFWPTWLWMGVLYLLMLLPYRGQMWLGKQLGMLSYQLVKKRRHIARVNIQMCFPDWNEQQREQLVKNSFIATGKAIFESAFTWWASDKRFYKHCMIEGLENLREAEALGKGVLLLGGHYTTLEMSGRIIAPEIPGLYPTYRPARNKLFEEFMARARLKNHSGLIRSADLRMIMRKIKQGNIVWYAPDQDFGRKRSVFAPFMGVDATTLTLTAHIAKATGCPVIPFFSERLADNSGVRARFGKMLTEFPSGDDVEDARRVNETIEQQIRRTPDQYLWLHRRFKTRPEGDINVYAR